MPVVTMVTINIETPLPRLLLALPSSAFAQVCFYCQGMFYKHDGKHLSVIPIALPVLPTEPVSLKPSIHAKVAVEQDSQLQYQLD